MTIAESESVNQGEGEYTRSGPPIGPRIQVHPLEGDATEDNQHFNDNISTIGHELQHALDDLGPDRVDAFNLEVGSPSRWNIIHTEWRAWAVQAAINYEHSMGKADDEVKLNQHQKRMLESFMKPETMTLLSDEFFRKTRIYINKHVFKDQDVEYTETETQEWMKTVGNSWLKESVGIFQSRIPKLVLQTGEFRVLSG